MMAIEEENAHHRQIWASVSQFWYLKASDEAITVGRLYHHLAILARPNILQQLALYTKSLCVGIPFKSTHESIHGLLNPIFASTQTKLLANNLAFVKAHGVLFTTSTTDEMEKQFPKPIGDMWADFDNASSSSGCTGRADPHYDGKLNIVRGLQ